MCTKLQNIEYSYNSILLEMHVPFTTIEWNLREYKLKQVHWHVVMYEDGASIEMRGQQDFWLNSYNAAMLSVKKREKKQIKTH